MRIYVARHGQTQWNLEDKICGRTDLPLTPLGLTQAEKLADRVESLDVDVILSSPMLRARQTAQASANRLGLPIEVDQRLIEQDYGIYESGYLYYYQYGYCGINLARGDTGRIWNTYSGSCSGFV